MGASPLPVDDEPPADELEPEDEPPELEPELDEPDPELEELEPELEPPDELDVPPGLDDPVSAGELAAEVFAGDDPDPESSSSSSSLGGTGARVAMGLAHAKPSMTYAVSVTTLVMWSVWGEGWSIHWRAGSVWHTTHDCDVGGLRRGDCVALVERHGSDVLDKCGQERDGAGQSLQPHVCCILLCRCLAVVWDGNER